METGTATLRFAIEGSQGDEYEVLAWRDGAELLITCTCQAAVNRRLCRHRVMLLNGVVDDLLGDNEDDVRLLKDLLRGTTMEAALQRFAAAERKLEVEKRAFDRAKADLGQHLALGFQRPLRRAAT
ncbi:MAG: SWIM zinc finger family protein [Geminicoccaceae bacterium]